MIKKYLVSASAVLLAVAAPAHAATQIVNGSGQLTGATGVIIFGASYDVEFVEGTCASVFDGCDGLSDFVFDQSHAWLAAQALLDQVFMGEFDTDYTRTFGCESNDLGACEAVIPFSWGPSWVAINNNTISEDSLQGGIIDTSRDSGSGSNGGYWVFARFTPSAAAVPEPSTWALMLLGFGVIGASLRGSRRRHKLLQLA